MTRGKLFWLASMVGLFLVPSARAVCIYHGKTFAKTSVAQEFSDSQWVVRVKVLAAEDHWPDQGDAWSIYHLQVVTAFKGNLPARIDMFTNRDSGGFYLDKGASHDLGGEYLLFLDPAGRKELSLSSAAAATEVNYPCGQSKPWSLVSKVGLQQLSRLSGS